MICPQCKTSNPDGAEKCSDCGLGLLDPDATVISSGPSDASASSADDARSVSSAAETLQGASGGKSFAAASQMATLPEGLDIGQRYRVVTLLGRGGMGTVYRVHDLELDRDVAFKVIRTDIAGNPAVLERFKREIQLSSKVTHRNVLRVYDLGESEGIRFVTMQLVEGEDLEGLLKREGRMPLDRVLDIFRQICKGLEAAHEQDVVHRDLKPQNIMLDGAGQVFLTDFGLAKSLQQTAMTQAGELLGTPFYMSPEQVKGQPVDRRSDIYSLGVILYELVTGRVPFSQGSMFEVMMQRLQQTPQPVTELNPDVPSYLKNIIERCMATDPAARYSTVPEILDDLDSGTFRSSLRYTVGRQRWLRPVATVVLVGALLGAGGWWLYRSGRTATVAVAPTEIKSVLIADFENRTGDFIFDDTLEPEFGIALEGASFINTFNRGQARRIAEQLQPGEALDEELARLVAVREGVEVVTSGSVERTDQGYALSVRAVDAATGEAIVAEQAAVSDKSEVLPAVARLAARVRNALGDTTPEAAQLAAAETFTAASLEAAHEYGVAQQHQYAGRYDDAIQHYSRATEYDPNLGRAYAGMAVAYFNQGQRDEAEKQYTVALARIDRMSDREKFRTRGGYFLIVRRDPDKAIEEYTQLVEQFPADAAGAANLALAWFYRRDMSRALQVGRRAIEISPRNVPQRNNVGLYAMYASDFETAIEEQQTVLEMNPDFALAYVGLALSELGAGRQERAVAAYGQLAALGGWGASLSTMGLVDVALYEGRLAEAVAILERGIEVDIDDERASFAANKLVALAAALLDQGRTAEALDAADRALSLSQAENTAFAAARVYLVAGHEARALELAEQLDARLAPDPRAYAALIRGEVKLQQGDARGALESFESAQGIADTWLGRFDLGRAYLELEAYLEADAEFEACLRRRGEATAVFLDEVPSYRLFPPVHYYLGRVLDGLNSPAAAESYQAYLAIKQMATGEDPLAADARRRIGAGSE